MRLLYVLLTYLLAPLVIAMEAWKALRSDGVRYSGAGSREEFVASLPAGLSTTIGVEGNVRTLAIGYESTSAEGAAQVATTSAPPAAAAADSAAVAAAAEDSTAAAAADRRVRRPRLRPRPPPTRSGSRASS